MRRLESKGIFRSYVRLHCRVSGISRSGDASVRVCRVVCGPGTNTNPSVGSLTLRSPGRVVNEREIAFGGFVRRLAPVCENTDWKTRPCAMPKPPRTAASPELLPVSQRSHPDADGSTHAAERRGAKLSLSAPKP